MLRYPGFKTAQVITEVVEKTEKNFTGIPAGFQILPNLHIKSEIHAKETGTGGLKDKVF
jgi:hypothetical protein